jgi:hypothetical protein
MRADWVRNARGGLSFLGSRLRKNWSDLTFVLLALVLFLWVANDAFTTRTATVSQSSDYWEHSATMRALLDDAWRPQNPHLVSQDSSPRFVPPFILSALLARACGFDALGAMGVASCLNMLLLLAGIFVFFRGYFRDRRASLYGLVVMFGSWFDAWHFSNVYQLKIFFSVVSYPSTAALGLSLLGFALTLRTLRGRAGVGWLLANAVCWAVVMVTHPLTAMLGLTGAMLLALTEPRVSLRLRARVAGAILLGAVLSLLWPYFSMLGVLRGGSHEHVSAIERMLTSDDDGESVARLHQFYRAPALMRALGAALLGLPVCLFLLVRRRHWFISLGALAMLLPFIVNAYTPLPLGHRFILLAVFFLQTALVWLLLKLSRGAPGAWAFATVGYRGWLSGALVAVSLLGLMHWNVEQARAHLAYVQRKMRGAESVNVRYARRVGELAGPKAVVLADARTSWPVPTFGPKVVTLVHGNPLLSDEAKRDADVKRFFRSSSSQRARLEIIERWGVTHVLARRAAAQKISGFLSRYGRGQPLAGGYLLYTVRPD